jgi:hypothetical protein
LTAAHCGDDGTRVRVTFDPAYEDGDKTYAGTFHADPAYPDTSSDDHDIAVVVFDKPIKGITITGDAVCRSTNVVYRLDTESARAFLGEFVTLP